MDTRLTAAIFLPAGSPPAVLPKQGIISKLQQPKRIESLEIIMKLLLTVVALVAFTHAAPTTHTLEIGSNGIVGSVSSPLVSIEVNILKDQEIPALVPGAVIDDDAESVAVVDTPIVDIHPVDVISVNPVIVEPYPIDVIAVSPPIIQPNPIDVISVSPPVVQPNPIDVISVNPVIVEPYPIDVIAVSPPIIQPNPIDVISVNPVIVEPNPIDVISVSPPIVQPNPIDVISVSPVLVEEPEPINVVDVTPGLASVEAGQTGSQIINVILNFVFGSDGSVSSVEVPQQTVNQLVGFARGL
ncbi:hypothetical protein MSG28_008535 [Choristoneura fumiferana]|uniref:Uncharacterized protein n=1 Tax=Choristoneura fumiferana TaxID=7141 RepID=A0ACC0J743_CHOFU|nr:hypothetical protein MSG28_008535 [Choristoneura fumiferana]